MVKPNLKRIDSWSIHIKSIVIISTIFFIGISGYFLCLRPILKNREKIYLNFKIYEKKLKRQLDLSSEYFIYKEKLKNIENKFDIHSDDAADKIILNVLIGQVSSFLKINKVHTLAIKKDFLNSLQVESNFYSTNNNIFNFLYQIIRLNKFILIEKFSWNFLDNLSKNKKNNIIFSFKIYFPYFYKKNLILALSKINKRDAKSARESCILTKYSLNKIKMLGFLSMGKYQDWGFVALPNKQVCKLKLGDYLGLEKGIVIGTYAHEIFIHNYSFDKIIKLSIEKRDFSYVKNYT